MKFAKRNVVVSGGSRGIGWAIAQRFAEEGARVAICSRTEHELSHALKHIAIGTPAITSTVDVSDRAAVESFVGYVQECWGYVDVLVNNAGIQGPIGIVGENDPEQWKRTLEVNVLGPFYLVQAVLPGMIRKRRGKIINLSGGGATSPRPRFSAYAASKSALVRLTETIADELRELHIDVNAIAPGAINTRMLQEVLEAGARAGTELADAERRSTSGGNAPDEAAELALFLASRASDGITGKLISALWDPWREADFQRRLRDDTDLATLRRIDAVHFTKTH